MIVTCTRATIGPRTMRYLVDLGYAEHGKDERALEAPAWIAEFVQ